MTLHEAGLCAAIVDLDGTMVDTVGDFEAALGRAWADLGLPPVGRAFILRTVGKGSEHLITRCLAEVGAAPGLYEQAWQRYQHHYLAINGEHSAVYPGVVEGLQALRAAGLRLVCLTNKPGAFARPLLAAKGLDAYFELVFGGDAFAEKKPHPLPLLKACEALSLSPARTLIRSIGIVVTSLAICASVVAWPWPCEQTLVSMVSEPEMSILMRALSKP